MTLPRSVAHVLSQHVTLEVEGIDRMYLNVYQPRLPTDRGVAAFFRFHRGPGQWHSPRRRPKAIAGALRRPLARQDRRAVAEVAETAAAPVPRDGPRGRLPRRRVDPPGRDLVDPGPGSAALGSRLLRGGDPRAPRPRWARPGAVDLRPPGHEADTGAVPH